MKKFISLLTVSIALSANLAHAGLPDIVRASETSSPAAFSSKGFVASNKDFWNDAPTLFIPGQGMATVGTESFEPFQVNNNGLILGGKGIEDQNTPGVYSYYFVLKQPNQNLVYLSSKHDFSVFSTEAAINDSNQIAIIHGSGVNNDTITFFNGPTQTAEYTFTNHDFAEVLIFADGTALVIGNTDTTSEVSLYQALLITPQGEKTVLPKPISRRLTTLRNVRVLRGHTIQFAYNNMYYVSELPNVPVRIKQPITPETKKLNVIDFDGKRTYLAHKFTPLGSIHSDVRGDHDVMITGNKVRTRLQCLYPNHGELRVDNAIRILENGDVLANVLDRKKSISFPESILGIVPRSTIIHSNRSYCADTTVRVIGSCAKYFGNSLIQNTPSEKEELCTAEVVVKSPTGLPLKGMNVHISGTFMDSDQFGLTDAKGTFQFRFTANPEHTYGGSIHVDAPYNDDSYITNENDIYLYGYHFV